MTTQASQTQYRPLGRPIILRGLPGAGKTTLANAIVQRLREIDARPFHVNADMVRSSLNSDLGFDGAARCENARRIGAVMFLAHSNGYVPVVDFVMPTPETRTHFNLGASGVLYDLYTVSRESGFQSRFSDTQSMFDSSPFGINLHYTLADLPRIVGDIVDRSLV